MPIIQTVSCQGLSARVRDQITHPQLTDGRGRDGSLGVSHTNVARLDMGPDKVDGGEIREGHGSYQEQHGSREEEKDTGDAERTGRHVGG